MLAKRTKPVLLAVGVVAGALAAGGVATASTLSGKQMQICIANKSGAVRVAGRCAKTEHKALLGVVGPKGATGAVGPTGLTGPVGPQGATGPQGAAVTLPSAIVQPDGHGGVTSSSTVMAWKVGTGLFCVGPATSNTEFDVVNPIVTPVTDASASHVLAFVVDGRLDCGIRAIEVSTESFDAATHSFIATDVAFNVLLLAPLSTHLAP